MFNINKDEMEEQITRINAKNEMNRRKYRKREFQICPRMDSLQTSKRYLNKPQQVRK